MCGLRAATDNPQSGRDRRTAGWAGQEAVAGAQSRRSSAWPPTHTQGPHRWRSSFRCSLPIPSSAVSRTCLSPPGVTPTTTTRTYCRAACRRAHYPFRLLLFFSSHPPPLWPSSLPRRLPSARPLPPPAPLASMCYRLSGRYVYLRSMLLLSGCDCGDCRRDRLCTVGLLGRAAWRLGSGRSRRQIAIPEATEEIAAVGAALASLAMSDC